MISKRFYIQIAIRITLIVCTALIIAYTSLTVSIYLALVFLVLLYIQAHLLINYVNRTNKKIAFFFEAIKNEDFSLTLSEDVPEDSFRELYKRVNTTNKMIQDIVLKNRTQESYYKEILKQADIGILTYNAGGHILYANPTIKRLLNCHPLNHIRQLESGNESLFALLTQNKTFDRKLIPITNEREIIQLAIKSSVFRGLSENVYLITLQDIRQELDKKETDSWMKLIRVLTHEIMNTVAPITSISDAVLKYYKSDGKIVTIDQLHKNHIDNTVKGLEVIKHQGNDLLDFVQSYRSFMNLPTPDREIIAIAPFLEKIKLLSDQEGIPKAVDIHISLENPELTIFADEKLLSQVVLNLVRNAIQSFDNQSDKNILIRAGIQGDTVKFIEVKDNGSGITPEQLSDIFVPFFTTKEDGSGIGLSLSKRVMQLHGGQIKVSSEVDKGTIFRLTF